MPDNDSFRIGIDLGGTKIAGLTFADDDTVVAETRVATPREDYAASIDAICSMVAQMERTTGARASVGVGIPGSLSSVTGLVQNANSTWLNGRPFKSDLEAALDRPIRMANDANCFALSEATDGSGAEATSLFGVIVGTGCGGGIVIGNKIVDGPHGIGGEWGHTPLPDPHPSEIPGPQCWCGRKGCMETWISGPAVALDHEHHTGQVCDTERIAERSAAGDPDATQTLERLADRMARGLASIVNILDPDVIVLGGGLSSIPALYELVPDKLAPRIFADHVAVDLRPPKWGPASGVRGAARLWP